MFTKICKNQKRTDTKASPLIVKIGFIGIKSQESRLT